VQLSAKKWQQESLFSVFIKGGKHNLKKFTKLIPAAVN